MIKKAREEVSWSEEEIEKLIHQLKIGDDSSGEMRDSTQYQFAYNGQTFPIDLEKVPAKYKKVFERLKDNLQVVKRE